MKKRPLSLTLIGWFLAVMGILSIFFISAGLKEPEVIKAMSQSPLPLPLQHALFALGVMVMTGCGMGILKGKNWARFLYLGWWLSNISMALVLGTLEASLIPSLILFIVIAYFLFRPAAGAFFSERKPE